MGNIPDNIRKFYFPNCPLALSDRTGIIPTLVPSQDFIESEGIGNFRLLLGGAPHIPGTINISWEQMPNLESTISLSESLEPDFFNQKKIKINHNISDIDKKAPKVIVEQSIKLLETLGYGSSFETPDLCSDPLLWRSPYQIVPGNHPMGTTRMSKTAENGVVNSNCRLHAFNNLYVASSSVFPTGGYANSTFTIIALALRLADHVRGL